MSASLRGRLDRTADLYLRLRADGADDPGRAWKFAVAAVRNQAIQNDLLCFEADVHADLASLPTYGGKRC